jgi:type I restriction enzyme M protein
MIEHLVPTGLAGFVLANGSMSSNQSGEGEIRRNIIEADLMDCMVALPGQLFYWTQGQRVAEHRRIAAQIVDDRDGKA